jgi:hypothetical protein
LYANISLEPPFDSSSSSIGITTLIGFRLAQLSLSILSRKVLQNAVASGTSNPQLGGEPRIWSVPAFATRGPQRLKRR